MSANFVLDAWSLMAFFQKEEPAAARMRDLFHAAQQSRSKLNVSIINVGEVYYRMGKVHGERVAKEALQDLRSLPVNILSVDNDFVLSAARWKMKYPISYADAFAVATAEALGATLVTGDPELVALAEVIQLEKLERNRT